MNRFALVIVFASIVFTHAAASQSVSKGCWIGLDASGKPDVFSVVDAYGAMLSNGSVLQDDGSLYGFKQIGKPKISEASLVTYPGSGDPLEGYASDIIAGKVGPIDGGWVSYKKGLNAVNVKLARTAFYGATPNSVTFPAVSLSDSSLPGNITISLSPSDVKNDVVSLSDITFKKASHPHAYSSGHFQLSMNGLIVPGITDISPVEVDCVTDSVGNPHLIVRNFVLTANVLAADQLYKWRKSVMDGKVDRKSVSIIFMNDAGDEVSRLNFFECWPAGIDDPAVFAITGETSLIIAGGSATYSR
jgi:hypothetical protein